MRLMVRNEGIWFLPNSLPAGILSAEKISYFCWVWFQLSVQKIKFSRIFFYRMSVYETCFSMSYNPKSILVRHFLGISSYWTQQQNNSRSLILHLGEITWVCKFQLSWCRKSRYDVLLTCYAYMIQLGRETRETKWQSTTGACILSSVPNYFFLPQNVCIRCSFSCS